MTHVWQCSLNPLFIKISKFIRAIYIRESICGSSYYLNITPLYYTLYNKLIHNIIYLYYFRIKKMYKTKHKYTNNVRISVKQT